MRFLPFRRSSSSPGSAPAGAAEPVRRHSDDAVRSDREAPTESEDTAWSATVPGEIPPTRQTDGHHLQGEFRHGTL